MSATGANNKRRRNRPKKLQNPGQSSNQTGEQSSHQISGQSSNQTGEQSSQQISVLSSNPTGEQSTSNQIHGQKYKRNRRSKNKVKLNSKKEVHYIIPRKLKASQKPRRVNSSKYPNANSVHAPCEVRLRHLIYFKEEQCVYSTDNIDKPFPVELLFKKPKPQFFCVVQLIRQGKRDAILLVIQRVLDQGNPLLINYDVIMIILALCLCIVKQEPNQVQPKKAPEQQDLSIIDFRKKVLTLAVDEIAAENSLLFVQFVYTIINLDFKVLNFRAVRIALAQWYLSKDCAHLLTIITRDGGFGGLTHSNILTLIHLDMKTLTPDQQFTIAALYVGFSDLKRRLETGKFPKNTSTPARIKAAIERSQCLKKGDEKLKLLINHFCLMRAANDEINENDVALLFKEYQMSLLSLAPKWILNYKINNVIIERSNARIILKDMYRLRKNRLITQTRVSMNKDQKTSADLFIEALSRDVPAGQPKIQPPEVLAALLEYKLHPESIKKHADDLGKVRTKPKFAKTNAYDIKTLSLLQPIPSVVSALEKLYFTSFSKMKKITGIVSICIDFQESFKNRHITQLKSIQGKDIAMMLVQAMVKAVSSGNLQVIGYTSGNKPITQLKLHTEVDKTDADHAPDTNVDKKVPKGKEDGSKHGILEENETLWQFYAKQVPDPCGIVVHRYIDFYLKNSTQPDVFFIITGLDRFSIYKANVRWRMYLKRSTKKNSKLITFTPQPPGQCRVIHRKNMLHILGFNDRVFHIMYEFIEGKIS